MNYLAHLYLAEDSDADMVGNLMGDFVKGRPEHLDYSPPIRRGILLHRAVDSFTDQHPVFRRSRARLDKPFRRFGGIIIDLAYDHFLANAWSAFSPEPLEQFASRAYRALDRHHDHLPEPLQRMAAAMQQQDWLCGYRRLTVIERSLAGIGQRFSRPTPLAEAGDELQRHYPALERDFHAFMPALIDYAAEQRMRLLGKH